MNRNLAFVGALLCLGPALPAVAGSEVFDVPGDFPTIQAAIDSVGHGDEIRVSSVGDGGDAATYYESIDFKGKAVRVFSTGGAFRTIIDASETGGSVARFVNEEPPGAILEGFTLRNGTGDTEEYGDPVGGGVYTGVGSMPTIVNCRLASNTADFGGGMFNDGDPLVVGCLFVANVGAFGGAVMNNNSDGTFTNCTFTRNRAIAGAGLYNTNSFPLVTSTIFWNNTPDAIRGAQATVHYSLVQGGWTGPGGNNISGPARFADDQGRLGPGSPAIDAGNSRAAPAWLELDLDGADRFFEIPRVANRGPADPRGPVDMGAFERFECVGDVTDDRMVDFDDVLRVLDAWGACSGCPEDINGDGLVGFDDLLAILDNWGLACPGQAARAPAAPPAVDSGRSTRKKAAPAKAKRKKGRRAKRDRRGRR